MGLGGAWGFWVGCRGASLSGLGVKSFKVQGVLSFRALRF